MGALGKQGCHLHTGRRFNKPPNTLRFPHSAHTILFRVFVAILPDKQQVFIDRQQVEVFIMIYVLRNERMPGPLWGVSGESLKGHEISMNSRAEVISILLLLPGPKGLCAQLPP